MLKANEVNEALDKPKTHAHISVVFAILKAYKLVELLAGLISLLALVGIMYAPNVSLKLLALLVFCVGLGVFYFALRIRIDIHLFELWDSLDISELDHALLKINANHSAGRTLEARLDASYQLFKRGISLFLVQVILLLIFAFKS
jgi:hypothetical protein